MPTPDKLNEAYEAWRRANDEHVDMMRAVTSGAPFDAKDLSVNNIHWQHDLA